MERALFAFSALLLAAWAARLLFVMRCIAKARFLRGANTPAGFAFPKLSVVIPARNEAENIEAALASRLRSTYPDLEFILINDRSADVTGKIMDRIAARDSRVRTIHVKDLPEGWLGKVNALRLGAEAATGEWLLFSDADVHISGDALEKAVYMAETARLDHLAVMPELKPCGFLADTALATLQDFALRWVTWDSTTSRPGAAVGIGAFNLVRRSAFERTPGFEWLRLEVIDDMGLALMMKRHGFRGRAVHGRDCVGITFVNSFHELTASCDKGIFAGADYNWGILAAAILAGVLFDIVPFVLLFTGGTVSLLAALSCVIALFKTLIASRWNRRPLLPALCLPLGGAICAYLSLHSMFTALKQGGIQWRGSFYPLAKLKEGKRFRFSNLY